MKDRSVKYWLKIGEDAFEPLATTLKGLLIEIRARGLMICPDCQAAVEPQGACDAGGIYSVCPFCGFELDREDEEDEEIV